MCFEFLGYAAGHRLPMGKLLKVQIRVWPVASMHLQVVGLRVWEALGDL